MHRYSTFHACLSTSVHNKYMSLPIFTTVELTRVYCGHHWDIINWEGTKASSYEGIHWETQGTDDRWSGCWAFCKGLMTAVNMALYNYNFWLQLCGSVWSPNEKCMQVLVLTLMHGVKSPKLSLKRNTLICGALAPSCKLLPYLSHTGDSQDWLLTEHTLRMQSTPVINDTNIKRETLKQY